MNFVIPSPPSHMSPHFHAPPPPLASTSTTFTWDHVDKDYVYTKQETILANEISRDYIPRSLSESVWLAVEQAEENTVNVGERFLVLRFKLLEFHDRILVTDYITKRNDDEAKWLRYTVVYYEDTRSPYSFDYDRSTKKTQ